MSRHVPGLHNSVATAIVLLQCIAHVLKVRRLGGDLTLLCLPPLATSWRKNAAIVLSLVACSDSGDWGLCF